MTSAAEETYTVHVSWTSSEPIADETMRVIGLGLKPDDETFCFWVDEKDPLTVIASWDLRARSIEDAARLCKERISRWQQGHDFEPRLSEIGVSTDEGYWVTNDPEVDIPG